MLSSPRDPSVVVASAGLCVVVMPRKVVDARRPGLMRFDVLHVFGGIRGDCGLGCLGFRVNIQAGIEVGD